MEYDLVIRNGSVVDGTGAPRVRSDVGVRDGRIVSVGLVGGRGAEEIDAEGLVVTPGFIDCHTHMDAQIMWDPLGRCSCYHGVTTVAMGNCGFTLAPASEAQRGLVVRNLERAEDISSEAMASGIPDWKWDAFPEYLDVLDALPKGINYAAQIGHSALRTWAMGERAFEEEATDDDLVAMEHGLRDALRAGAIGFSTSRSASHETSDDRPVASRHASYGELRRLIGAMGDEGTGIFQLALGEDVRSEDPVERAAAQATLQSLTVETGVPMTFNVFPRTPTDWRGQLALIEDTAAKGGRIYGQSSSRGVSVLLSFKTTMPFDKLSEWQAVRSLPIAEQMRALRDPTVRARLVHAAHHGDYGRSIGAEARKPEFDKLRILDHPVPPFPVVADVAAARGLDPVELMIDLALDRNLDLFFMQALSIHDDDTLGTIMAHPRTVMTFSDSGAHVSQIMDSSIQTHLLAYWVRDREVFTFEEAIRMITLVPSTIWGFHDRGLVRAGFAADLNVIDPATIAPRYPTVVSDLPAGARRLDQRADGLLATVVGGEVLLRDGEHTGALPGRLVRGRLASG